MEAEENRNGLREEVLSFFEARAEPVTAIDLANAFSWKRLGGISARAVSVVFDLVADGSIKYDNIDKNWRFVRKGN